MKNFKLVAVKPPFLILYILLSFVSDHLKVKRFITLYAENIPSSPALLKSCIP